VITNGTVLSLGNYRNLYNGNIARTINSFMDINQAGVKTIGKAYSYDQLSRLKTANAYSNVNTSGIDLVASTNSFNGASDNGSYSESFSYDPNGNIMSVNRFGNTVGSKMDEMTYHYGTSTNKLNYVSDDPSLSGHYTDDIDDQTNTGNYDYDGSGNLTKDAAEEIAAISWNVYGKIKTITRVSTSLKSDLEFTYDATGNRLSKIVKPRNGSGILTESNWTYTYYTRDAQGNVMAVYDRKLSLQGGTVKDKYTLKEHDIYGSSRLGIEEKNTILGEVNFAFTDYTADGNFFRPGTGTLIAGAAIPQPTRTVGDKEYELSNHLGNVMVVVSDKKIGIDADNAGTEKQAEAYTADVMSSQDYYAFGAMMPGRKYSGSTGYRYAFGGKEKNDEIKGVVFRWLLCAS
jgi:hypothetical protein